MRRPLVSAAALTTPGIGGCGGDDDSGTGHDTDDPRRDGAVLVVAEDLTFPEDPYETTAGTVGLRSRNDGGIPRTFVIEDVGGFKLEVAGDGDEDTGTVDLDAGGDELDRDVAGHREAGMQATLEGT